MSFRTPEGPSEAELRKNRFVDDAGNLRLGGLYGLEDSIRVVATEVDGLRGDHGEMLRTLTQRLELLDKNVRDMGKDMGKRIDPARSAKAKRARGRVGEEAAAS